MKCGLKKLMDSFVISLGTTAVLIAINTYFGISHNLSLQFDAMTREKLLLKGSVIPKDGYQVGYILNNPQRCKPENDLKVVIAVVSSTNDSNSRLAIRRTWGTACLRRDVAMVFILGATDNPFLQNEILEENLLYGDIVQGTFTDTYRNLTLKSVALLRWGNSFCQNAEYVLKVDSDTFVHLPHLLDFIATRNVTKKVIYGRIWHGMWPNRNNASKFFISMEDYSGKVFPDYVSGPSYLISMDSVDGLLKAATMLSLFPLEDAFITGVCAEYANISRVHSKHFVDEGGLDSAENYKTVITAHGVTTSMKYDAWKYANMP